MVVFGGGPIGTLIALVSRHRGAEVKVVEINPHRVEILKRLGLDAIGPDEDVKAAVNAWTDGTGADVAFEVSGSPTPRALVTEVVRVWGTVSIIAIHSEPVPFHLYSLFARELSVHGSRLYTRAAWEEAIRLAASGAVRVGPLVSRVIPLDDLQNGMEEALGGGPVMKVLVDLRREPIRTLELYDATVVKDDRPVLGRGHADHRQRRAHRDPRAERRRQVIWSVLLTHYERPLARPERRAAGARLRRCHLERVRSALTARHRPRICTTGS